MNIFSRAENTFLSRWWWTVDRPMLAAVITLSVIGVMLVTTASPAVAERIGLGSFYFLKRHVVLLLASLSITIGVSMLEERAVRRLATGVLGVSLLCMVAVLFFGMEIKGAQRWIHVFGFSLQPSELAKPSFIIIAGWLMAMQKTTENIFPGNLAAAGLYFVVLCLLLLQPDLGMTVVVTAAWASQIFLAGFPFRWLFAVAILGVSGLWLAYENFSHVQSRINRFLDPESGDNFQVEKSLEAFRNGGLLGTGPGQGTVKLSLPDAHADFIFSVGAEEMGLIFVLLLIILFGFIVIRGYNRLMECESIFTVLSVGGLLTIFGLQALVHMGSSLNVLPAKGMTLPFLSYGGSSILSTGFSMGVILALTRQKRTGGISRAGLSSPAKGYAE